MMARKGVWSDAIRQRFLALLRETGNVGATLRVVGHANMFYKRRRRDPDFAREWAEAVAAADARLSAAESAFPEAEEGRGTGTSACPLSVSAEELGGYLRPKRKRRPSRPQPVIRRTSNGKAQIALAREGHLTAEGEAEFLALLRATGNFAASARAIGFQPASLHERARKWPAFARECEAALAEARTRLDYALIAYAHMLLGIGRASDGGAGSGTGDSEDSGTGTSTCPPVRSTRPPVRSTCPPVRFDPEMAMKILAFLDRRAEGRAGGRRKGPPDRSFEEARDSILAKLAAIERHEAMLGKKDEGDAQR